MPLHLDKLPKGHQKREGGIALYLFSTQTDGWARNREDLRHPNDQGGRSIANIAAGNSVVHSKGAPPDQAGGLLRQTYICKGGRCV